MRVNMFTRTLGFVIPLLMAAQQSPDLIGLVAAAIRASEQNVRDQAHPGVYSARLLIDFNAVQRAVAAAFGKNATIEREALASALAAHHPRFTTSRDAIRCKGETVQECQVVDDGVLIVLD